MLTALTRKVDNKQEQKEYCNQEILRIKMKFQKKMLENTIEGMKSAFEGLIGRSDIAEEGIW